MITLHETKAGQYFEGRAEKLLKGKLGHQLKGKVQLVLTSPPFPLNHKKSYGNLEGRAYKDWFVGLAEVLGQVLTPDGSIVIEMGNAWMPGRPVQSLLPLESLLAFVKSRKGRLRLCQEFICYNPARLPSPAQWVTVKRERVTDSYTRIWWMSKSDRPKAHNSTVLRPYSNSMRELLERQTFNRKPRPSEHHISENGFLADHGGSISHNFFELDSLSPNREARLPNAFALTNTSSGDFFGKTCQSRGIQPHPARMQAGLAAYFLEFLTEPGDLVLDPFAGSNTTGYVSELLCRRWVAIDAEPRYAVQSKIRFEDPLLNGVPPPAGQVKERKAKRGANQLPLRIG